MQDELFPVVFPTAAAPPPLLDGGRAVRASDLLRALGAAGDAVALIDAETDRLLDANDSMRRLAGWSGAEAIPSERVFAFLRPEDRAIPTGAMRALAAGTNGGTGIVRMHLRTALPRGAPLVYDTVLALTEAAGRRTILAMLRRASRPRALGLEAPPFRPPWDELRLRDEFEEFRAALAEGLAQGIRTPLTPIKLQLHRLREEVGRDRAVFDVVERNLRRVQGVVDDAIEAMDLQSGRANLRVGAVELPGLVARAVAECADAATARGFVLRLHSDAVAPIQGDRVRLARAVRWLIETALAEAAPGGPVAQVRVLQRPLDVVVEASTGWPGDATPVPAAGRLPGPSGAIVPGALTAGRLGRYLVRVIAQLHGGSLQEQPEAATRGVKLVLALPLAPPRVPPAPGE